MISVPQLQVRYLGDPVLREPALPVNPDQDELPVLLRAMFRSMRALDGLGLAAPQVGRSLRVFVLDVPGTPPAAYLNPHIEWASPQIVKDEEGCLSLPGLRVVVPRASEVRVRALRWKEGTRTPEECALEASGLLARALQHEIDHLNGVLILDYASPIARAALLSRWKKIRPLS